MITAHHKLKNAKLHGISMLPLIRSGDRVVYNPDYPFAHLELGHVIIWQGQGMTEPVAHTVVGRRTVRLRKWGLWGPVTGYELRLRTKGLNNRFRDRHEVTPKTYLGRVERVWRNKGGMFAI